MLNPSIGGLMVIQLLKARKLNISCHLSQIVSEPNNLEPNKKPSCIDLVITDQPYLNLDSGTRAFLGPYCHHQIIYCKVNFSIPPPPTLGRIIWHYNRASTKRSMWHLPKTLLEDY